MKLSLNVGLAWPEIEDLYAVGYRGQTVGKMWFAADKKAEAMPWEWHLCIPMTMSNHAQGAARDKAQALQALANSLHTLLLRTPPERIERAFQLSAATGLDFASGEQVELSVEEIVEPAAIGPAEPVPVEVESFAATAENIAPSVVAPPAPPQPRLKVSVVKNRMPVARVKMVTFNKGAAHGGISRPVSVATSVERPPLPPATDA